MDWKPISESSLWDLINEAEQRMSVSQGRLWEAIRVQPMKWQQPSYGKAGGGFWVVAVVGEMVIWYNDIEDGFNLSLYRVSGTIREYWCNQDRLEQTVQHVLNFIETGNETAYQSSPPIPGAFGQEP